MISKLEGQFAPNQKHPLSTQTNDAQHQVYRWLVAHQQWWMAPLVLGMVLLLWDLLVRWQQLPPFILPSPLLVARKFWLVTLDGTLWRHAQTTLLELFLGLTSGLSVALLLGYLLGKSRKAERLAAPYIVASQSIPVVAIAPLLVIWLGSGLASKVVICALIVFFPTLISAIVGMRNVNPEQRAIFRSLAATPWQTFRHLELPAALPVIFGGLKLSAILSVVGAVVAEFMGADVGLGFLINLANGVLDTPLMVVAVLALVLIAQSLYLVVTVAERILLSWQRQQEM